jgi:hypothetical protein
MRLLFFTLIVAAATVTKAGQVVLTSDPPGASIYAGDKQLGTTPLTMDLPSGPTVLTSRFGSLAPVTETVTSDEEQASSFNFQHAYGILIVSSDREDAELTIDAAAFGHPPALLFVTPGTHKVFLTAPNAPDESRNNHARPRPKPEPSAVECHTNANAEIELRNDSVAGTTTSDSNGADRGQTQSGTKTVAE